MGISPLFPDDKYEGAGSPRKPKALQAALPPPQIATISRALQGSGMQVEASMRDNTEKPFSKAEVDAIRRSFGDETRLFSEFWALIRRIGRSIPFAEDIVAAYFCAIDPSTSPRAKVILIGAILYFVMPIDAIPDVLPIIGFTDDAAVLAAAIAAVKPWITELHRKKAREALAENA